LNRLLPALLLAGALGAAPAVAADHDSTAPADPPANRPNRPDPPAPAVQASTALDQGAIFSILCGGLPMTDRALSHHLWQMAGSLADSSWTPPRVTVHVVVSEPSIR
jgi:hypothetical protein